MATSGSDPGGFLSGMLGVVGPRLEEMHQQNLAKKMSQQQAEERNQWAAKKSALTRVDELLKKQAGGEKLTDQENQDLDKAAHQWEASDAALTKMYKPYKPLNESFQKADLFLKHYMGALRKKGQKNNLQGPPSQQPGANEESLAKQGQAQPGASNAQPGAQPAGAQPGANKLQGVPPDWKKEINTPGSRMATERAALGAEPTDPNLLKLELEKSKREGAAEAAKAKKDLEELTARHKQEKEELEAKHKTEFENQVAKDKAAQEAQHAADVKEIEALKTKDAADRAAAKAAAKPAKVAKAEGSTPAKISEKRYVPGGESVANPAGDMAIDGGAWIFIQNNGHLPFTGFGATKGQSGVNRRELMIARAGEILADLGLSFSDLPAIAGKIKGDSQALARVSTMGAMVKQFEGTLTANMETAKTLSEAWQRSDFPLVNRIVAAYKTGKGDPEALNLAAQLHGVAREWGKIMAGSTSSSGVTVSEANAADLLLNKGISNGQLLSFMQNVILPDVKNRTGAIEGERQRLIDSLRGDVKSTAGPQPVNNLTPPPPAANDLSSFDHRQP